VIANFILFSSTLHFLISIFECDSTMVLSCTSLHKYSAVNTHTGWTVLYFFKVCCWFYTCSFLHLNESWSLLHSVCIAFTLFWSKTWFGLIIWYKFPLWLTPLYIFDPGYNWMLMLRKILFMHQTVQEVM
jgi:hypothetical protein